MVINVLCVFIYKVTLQHFKSRMCERLWRNVIAFQMVPVILSLLIIFELSLEDRIFKAEVYIISSRLHFSLSSLRYIKLVLLGLCTRPPTLCTYQNGISEDFYLFCYLCL